MMTIKLYTIEGKQQIETAEAFTIHRHKGDTAFEVTGHGSPNGVRWDIGPTKAEPIGGNWDWAFIINEQGRTVETLRPMMRPAGGDPI
jgi:hypothetical protein